MATPANTVQQINRSLDQATRSIDQVSGFIKQLEQAMQALERDKGEVKKDVMAKVELSTCASKVQSLKSAISRLEMELSDTQTKINKVTW